MSNDDADSVHKCICVSIPICASARQVTHGEGLRQSITSLKVYNVQRYEVVVLPVQSERSSKLASHYSHTSSKDQGNLVVFE